MHASGGVSGRRECVVLSAVHWRPVCTVQHWDVQVRSLRFGVGLCNLWFVWFALGLTTGLLLWAGRLKGKCHMCPNTAWLLFLLFALGLVFLVAVSVYLSRKRLNLAVLGIGVVGGKAF